MIMQDNLNKKTLHHANVIIGLGNPKDFIFGMLRNDLNFEIANNPDFLFLENQTFGIDDARELERWAMGKPFLGEAKVSILIIKSITHEAQNALLKILEEPPLGTYFFMSLENLGGLLPTFISRVRILNLPNAPDDLEENDISNNARKFLKGKIKDRLAMARSLSRSEDKSKMKELIKEMEKICYENSNDKIYSESEAMKNILTAKIFASARGSSPKMLLEWLSCVL